MSQCKVLVEKATGDRYEIERIKKTFESKVSSNRRFEQISNIKELLKVLENRNAISSDTLGTLEKDVQTYISSFYKVSPVAQNIEVPKKVLKLINQSLEKEWEDFGLHLRLTKSQILKCNNIEEVLLSFEENCQGVSQMELLFRLDRALEKSRKIDLKLKVMELVAKKQL